MKKVLSLAVALVLFSVSVAFAEYVNGYTRKDGTYVSGYNRSEANDTVQDNYSYKGNSNPHTGERGDNYYRNSTSSEYYGTSPKSKKSSWNDSDD